MRSILHDERGGIGEYVNVLIAVGLVCGVWIIMDEMVFRLGSVASNLSAGTPGFSIMAFVVNCWRVFPFVVAIGAILWVILKATQDEPYQYVR